MVTAVEHLAGYGWSIRPDGQGWVWLASGRKGFRSGTEPSRVAAERTATAMFERLR